MRTRTVMRTAGIVLAIASTLITTAGCTAAHTAAASTDVASTAAPITPAAATPSETATDAPAASATDAPATDAASPPPDAAAVASSGDGSANTGHVSITGDYALDHDFTVETCSVAEPGDGLLSGYRMHSTSGDTPIGLVTIALKNYAKDGAYVAPAATAVNAADAGLLGLTVTVDEKTALRFVQGPDSKLAVTVSDAGAKGTVQFTGLVPLAAGGDVDVTSAAALKEKRVSGSVSWSCRNVRRIDAKASGVDGMSTR